MIDLEHQKPKCANPMCNRDGWVMIGYSFYCGECVAKWHNNKIKQLQDDIENG
jgi:uncharacterized Zn ribbon protein